MKLEGTKELDAPRETVWAVLNDPEQMADLMPGVEGFDIKDDRNWTAKVKVPLGLGGLRLTVDFEKIEEREPEYAQLKAKGNGRRRDHEHDDRVPAGRGRAVRPR